jgi:ABC-2 type transport system ATP-binding protein
MALGIGRPAVIVPDPIVQIEHLTHAYGQRVALNDLSLRVDRGEIFGFLGPNGSGKTTLFRILSTLIASAPGAVRILGLDLATHRDDIRRQIGVVFQSPSLDKQLTAVENLRHQGHLYGLRGSDLSQRIDAMLTRVGMADRPRELCGRLSGGQRRRIELAKGLLHRPRLLLLDEPSTGLDPGARIDLWRYLRQIRQQDGVTVLVTTHLMDEAEHCDRLAILDSGRLAACDAPTALKERIGGDVITLITDQPGPLRMRLREKFGLDAAEFGQELRIERPRGHEFIPPLVEAFPGMIRSIALGKPTLEDVFIQVTGHRFRDPEDVTPSAPASP